jgi:uncharacterized protein (DUF362 family)
MKTEEKIQKLPEWIKRIVIHLKKIRIPVKLVYILVSLLASIWFLFRVIPKPTRAAYPCMQVAAPIMSGFVIWLLAITTAAFAFKKAKNKFLETRYLVAGLFLIIGIGATTVLVERSAKETRASNLDIWYKPNIPIGVAKGIYPGRVAWGHNPEIASWDGKTGFWWEDRFNDQRETNKLFSQTILSLTGKKSEKESWEVLFKHFNQTKNNKNQNYQSGEKVVVKINQNNTSGHENTNEINANPQVILSLLNSLIKEAGVPEEMITVADPSRFITNNIFDKCHAVYPKVRFVDHVGGNGREKATFTENGFLYSFDFNRSTTGLATCMVDANYVIDLALLKGHNSQGVTLSAKNFFGCVDIETDWRKNAHGSGFSQNKEGKRTYSVYPDFIGHKDLGAKTILFLIDGIYSNKFVNQKPGFKWKLAPFNDNWPGSLFASQDPVAIDAVALDFAITEWPDAPDMKYSDFYLEEMALAHNPPSGTVYDPERDGTRLTSLGVTEHWNNPIDKKYSRNLKTGEGIELIYKLVKN